MQRRRIFNSPIGEDHRQRADRIARGILQLDLGFDTSALRVDCGMRDARVRYFDIVRVRHLANTSDVRCNDRQIGAALRRLGVQGEDLHLRMPRQRVVDQKLRVVVGRHSRVELRLVK